MGDCWTQFRTRKDGVVYPIPGPCQKAFAALVVLLALASTGAASVGAAAAVGGATTVEAAAAQSLSVRVSNGRSAAQRGQYSNAWLRMSLRHISRQTRTDPGCTAHSTGQVRKCFLTDPCLGLQRSLITLVDDKGRTITVSISWVRMPNSVSARHLKRLVDRPGTGSLSPVVDPVGVRFTGKHYASRRAGSVVITAEAAAGSGRVGSALLDGIADVAAQFPGP